MNKYSQLCDQENQSLVENPKTYWKLEGQSLVVYWSHQTLSCTQCHQLKALPSNSTGYEYIAGARKELTLVDGMIMVGEVHGQVQQILYDTKQIAVQLLNFLPVLIIDLTKLLP